MYPPLVSFAGKTSRALGLYKPLRSLYHFVVHSRETRIVVCARIEAVFSAPTSTIAEHIVSLTGEEQILNHMIGQLQPGDIVWDVGASFGMYAIFAGKALAATGTVHAFEPEPRMKALLEKNIRLNTLENITVHSEALGNADGTTILFPFDSPNVGTSALVQRSDCELKSHGLTVRICEGDSIVRQGEAPLPTVIKIDVEGAEAHILSGIKHTLRMPSLRVLYCEVHPHLLPRFNATTEGVERCILEAGLTIASRHSRGTEYHLICTRNP